MPNDEVKRNNIFVFKYKYQKETSAVPYDEVKRNNILSLNISIRRKHLLYLMMR